jgi:hypothetical protein
MQRAAGERGMPHARVGAATLTAERGLDANQWQDVLDVCHQRIAPELRPIGQVVNRSPPAVRAWSVRAAATWDRGEDVTTALRD